MLGRLLEGLRKPYCYKLERIYFDWLLRKWRMLPEINIDQESFISSWINELKEKIEIDMLESLAEEVTAAINEINPPV